MQYAMVKNDLSDNWERYESKVGRKIEQSW